MYTEINDKQTNQLDRRVKGHLEETIFLENSQEMVLSTPS